MEDVIERVLILDDGKHDVCFVTQFNFYSSAMELIGKLRDPHHRLYQFRSIYIEDLDTYEEENAWYVVNTANIPWPFDPMRKSFTNAFDLLWERGKEVFKDA